MRLCRCENRDEWSKGDDKAMLLSVAHRIEPCDAQGITPGIAEEMVTLEPSNGQLSTISAARWFKEDASEYCEVDDEVCDTLRSLPAISSPLAASLAAAGQCRVRAFVGSHPSPTFLGLLFGSDLESILRAHQSLASAHLALVGVPIKLCQRLHDSTRRTSANDLLRFGAKSDVWCATATQTASPLVLAVLLATVRCRVVAALRGAVTLTLFSRLHGAILLCGVG